jgi:tRNA nucleotidyltransferase/poly(A) polymerase
METTIPKSLITAILSKNGRIFQVGGSVRDELLGVPLEDIKDLDLLVTGIDLERLISLLKLHGKLDLVGKSFGVIKFNPFGQTGEPIDISVPRQDNKVGDDHKAFEVKTDGVTLEEDLLRRDFTINAMAKDIITGELIDLDGKGLEDIKNRTLRMVKDNTFFEDPLRMLRAIQQSARFDCAIELKTMSSMAQNSKLIHTISKDRFQEEFGKLFLRSNLPSLGLCNLNITGLFDEIFPFVKFEEVDRSIIDNLPKDNLETFFVALFLNSNIKEVVKFLKEFRFSNDSVMLIKESLEFLQSNDISDKGIVTFNNDKKSSDKVFDIIDTIFRVRGISFSIISMLGVLRDMGIPTSLKELPVNGDDLLANGLKGKEIFFELRRLLLEEL